jgi:hypothetical protein
MGNRRLTRDNRGRKHWSLWRRRGSWWRRRIWERQWNCSWRWRRRNQHWNRRQRRERSNRSRILISAQSKSSKRHRSNLNERQCRSSRAQFKTRPNPFSWARSILKISMRLARRVRESLPIGRRRQFKLSQTERLPVEYAYCSRSNLRHHQRSQIKTVHCALTAPFPIR